MALQLKHDELIVATKHTRNHMPGIEGAPDAKIEEAKVEVRGRAT